MVSCPDLDSMVMVTVLAPKDKDESDSLDSVGISMNFVILRTDPRYYPGHRYKNANIHLGGEK